MLLCYCYFVTKINPAREERMPCSLRAFVLITHSVYGVQCFLTENWGFVNVFLPTLDPSFLVVEDNRCNFAVYKGIHCKVKRQQLWFFGPT